MRGRLGNCLDSQDISPQPPAAGDALVFRAPGGWTPTPNSAPVTQAAWYIDGVAGSDSNTGALGSPLKTWAGMVALMGRAPYLNLALSIFITNDLLDAMVIPSFVQGPLAEIHIHGTPIVVRSGALSAVTGRNPPTNQADEFTDGVHDWTADVGMFVSVDVGDPVNGPASSWVARALGGPNRARMFVVSQRSAIDPFNLYPFVCSPGQSYQVLRFPKIPALIIPTSLLNTGTSVQFTIEHLDFTLAGRGLFGVFHVQDCNAGGWTPGLSFGFNCLYAFLAAYGGLCSTYFGGVIGSFVFVSNSELECFGLFMQASKLWWGQTAALNGILENHHAGYGLAVFDQDTPLQIGPTGQLCNESTVYGTGLTTCCVHAFSGGRSCTFNNPVAVQSYFATGGGMGYSDFLLNGHATLPAVDTTAYGVPGAAPFTAPRACSFANLALSVAGGGFGGTCIDPADPATAMSAGQGL